MSPLRLGLNVDHVATLRNARGGAHPDPVRAASLAMAAGVDGITAHLREDRRHIRDRDVERLRAEVALPLNLEMAAAGEMLAIALRIRPHAVCLVPERRQEVTTEGGLDAASAIVHLRPIVSPLVEAGIEVALFVDPHERQLEAAARLGAPAVELHTGTYCEAEGTAADRELARLAAAAALCPGFGLECHAGHGLTTANVGPVAAIPQIVELNIGHFIIGEAVTIGLEAAIRAMRAAMAAARGASTA